MTGGSKNLIWRRLVATLPCLLLATACGSSAGSHERSQAQPTTASVVGDGAEEVRKATGGWLSEGPTGVLFLKLAGARDSLAGSVSAASIPDDGSPLEPQTAQVTARQSGTELILSVAGEATWTGHIGSDGSLSIEAPGSDGSMQTYRMHRATAEEYNAALAQLRAAVSPIGEGSTPAADFTATPARCAVEGDYFTSTGSFTNTSGHRQGFTFRVSWVYQPSGLDKTSYPVVATGLLDPGESYSWSERVASALSYTLPLRCEVIEVEYAR
jgi:hypothetical protein